MALDRRSSKLGIRPRASPVGEDLPMSRTHLAATIIYVPDVPAALDFWERAFGLQRSYLAPDGDYGELGTDGARIGFDSVALAERWGPPGGFRPVRPADRPAGVELMLHADDVPSALARAVEAGASALGSPEERPWGQTIAYVCDPWGTLVAIGTPWRAPGGGG